MIVVGVIVIGVMVIITVIVTVIVVIIIVIVIVIENVIVIVVEVALAIQILSLCLEVLQKRLIADCVVLTWFFWRIRYNSRDSMRSGLSTPFGRLYFLCTSMSGILVGSLAISKIQGSGQAWGL